MVRALAEAQQQKAILSFSKTGNNNLTEALKDNVVLDYAGIRAKDLESPARRQLRDLVQLYVSNMDNGHARVKMREVEKHIENTWFAWVGGTQDDSVFYCRIQSPVILIEFDHQRPPTCERWRKNPVCRRSSIFIAWCARQTGTIMGRTCCDSTI